jgi:hypothetical protein
MVIGPVDMPPARAIVMFCTAVPSVVVAKAEASAGGVAEPVVEDCAGALADDAPPAVEADDDAAPPEDRGAPDVDSEEADKDGLAEQPATARAARTA